MISSAAWMSSSVTVPLPMPIVSPRATPLDSWHMFEQSGRLLVPERADEQLVQEGGLVARAARRVEDGTIGGRQRPQTIGDEVDGARPSRSAGSASSPARSVHRLGQAALLAEPVVGSAGEVGDRVGGEEVGGDPAVGGLLGDGLGPVLAELETATCRAVPATRTPGSRNRPAG